MSTSNAKEMNFTPQLVEKMKSAKSSKELIDQCRNEGIELGKNTAEKWYAQLNQKGTAGNGISFKLLGTIRCPKCGSTDYTQRYIPISPYDGNLWCHCNHCGYDKVIG
jgi:ribosomal protein L37E